MNILITGSNGFIGKYFIEKYKSKYSIKTFSFLKDDFNALECENIDTIIHLSALVHQMGGASKEEYERINVEQTISLANKAKSSGVKHFIFMSTVKVYGEETDEIYTEDYPCTPEDDYGKSKLKAEQELLKLEDSSFKISILRTPIVYGNGVKANIKSLVKLVTKIPLIPLGSINNKRSMVYIGNLCHIIDEMILQKRNGVFLSADDKAISTTELISFIVEALNKNTILFKIPFFELCVKVLKPSFYKRLYCNLEVNNQLTKEKLNINNPYTTKEGIFFMINGESK